MTGILLVVLALLGAACTMDDADDRATPGPSSEYQGHGVESLPAETLAKYAPPPLAPEVRTRVQAMLDVRAPGAGRLTADGKRMFFSWSVTGTTQVWRLDRPDGFPVQMTGGEERTSLAGVMPDGRHIVVSRDRGGDENPGLYLQPADGGPLQEIIRKDKVRAFLSFITDDGGAIYYGANDRKPDSYAIYRYDLASRRHDLVFGQDGLWFAADNQGEEKFLLEKQTESTSSEFFEFDPATKTLRPLLGQGEREEYYAVYGHQPGELVVLTPKLGEFRRLYRWREGELTPVSPEMPHDVSSFSIDFPRSRILYTVNENGYTRLRAMDAATFAEPPLPAWGEADHVDSGATTRDGRYTTITIETSRAPATSFVLDWSRGELTRWHVASAPEIDLSRFATATLEHYPARDGTKIPMLVRRPPPETCRVKPCPVVVSFHGGPEGQAVPGFATIAQLFVDAGFVFVEPNVRGSDGYGKAWLHADDGRRRLQVVTDIEDAARFIRSDWAEDGRPPRIGVYGISYGGYATLMGMTRFAGAYDAGASVVGIGNLITFLENTAAYRQSLRTSEYGDPKTDRRALVELSPITYIDRAKDPLLLIQGATDPRVPVGEAIQIHEGLADRKVASELIIFPDEGHGAVKRENRVLQYGHVVEFFVRHLAGKAS